MLKAKRAIEEMLGSGRVVVLVPKIENDTIFGCELIDCGIAPSIVHVESKVDVKRVRERLGLTQEQFSLRYGLDLDTLQNWEAGRRQPDAAARSYLKVIDRLPNETSEALEDEIAQAILR